VRFDKFAWALCKQPESRRNSKEVWDAAATWFEEWQMNQLPSRNEWRAFDRAIQVTARGRTGQKPVELSLSGTHTQSAPFLNATNQFGAKLVQFTVEAVPVPEPANPVISKKILAAMTVDPDPAASLADLRKLLVGPTRNLHDAMFEEIVTILEESDLEVQQFLRSLTRQCAHLSDLTSQLASSSVKSKDEARKQTENFQEELQKSATLHQEMLSEMFLAIDSKIQALTAQVTQKMQALAKKAETQMLEVTAGQERRMRELEAKCLASSKKAAGLIETRVASLEGKSGRNDDALHEVLSSGLSNIAERLKLLGDQSPER
jgi:hypothetical protein